MRRIPTLLVLAALSLLCAVGVTQAAVGHASATKHKKVVKHPVVHGLRAPGLLSPANGARVQQLPALTWSAVSGAVEYEYQVAADPQFHSLIAVNAGFGTTTPKTHNLGASLEKPVTDGSYYWRVRGLSAAKKPGPWSGTRKIVKAWAEAPQLLGPSEGAQITWPSTPLVLHWSEVPYAYEYIVTIATDEQMANIVLGSSAAPQKTEGTVFAMPSTLPAGQTYYWQITPVDATGHRGTPSRVGKFGWAWPSTTSTEIADLNPDPRVFEPEFKWAPVPGAARYEVEVSSASGFPAGSKWCCGESILGTSFVPTAVLANNEYFWRVRAVDVNGNAGVWNEGPSFVKAFDNTAPSIENLTMTDTSGNPISTADPTTSEPIVTWSPVPGASSYEVQATRYTEGSGCNWVASEIFNEKETVTTAGLAWSPLAHTIRQLNQNSWPIPTTTQFPLTEASTPYCVRVLARSDHDAQGNIVDSAWTQVNGNNKPAFTFASQPTPSGPLERAEAGDYLLPQTGTTTPRTPLFTWQRVPGASAYWVVIARDPTFTHVIDVGYTAVPAYTPRLKGEEPLDDETTAYYWAVLPAGPKEEVPSEPLEDAPQSFNKSSVPPAQIAPVGGVEIADQPTFRWTPAEGALNYTLQVATSPTFSNPIDNVKTDSTAYTSSSTYPAHETLYWRVRANDASAHNEGLNWSGVQTFKRTLPVPVPLAFPTSGSAIPLLEFTSVPGATAYDVHVEQPNGATREYKSATATYTATKWEGPGILRLSARAEFPTSGFASVAGSFYAPLAFAHTISPPSNAVGVKSGSRIVVSWNPQAYAKQYEVAISASETFNPAIETHRVMQTNWAPNVDLTKPANKGTLYWRVAAVDQQGNVGPYVTGKFVPPKPKCVVKKVKRKKKTVKVCVTPKKTAKKPTKKHH